MKINEYSPKEGWLAYFQRRNNEDVSPAMAVVFAILTIAFPFIYSIASFLDG